MWPFVLDTRAITEQTWTAAYGNNSSALADAASKAALANSPGVCDHHLVRLVRATGVPWKAHVTEVRESTHDAHPLAPLVEHY